MTLGVGQFCTNPGLILAPSGAALERFMIAAGISIRGIDEVDAGLARFGNDPR